MRKVRITPSSLLDPLVSRAGEKDEGFAHSQAMKICKRSVEWTLKSSEGSLGGYQTPTPESDRYIWCRPPYGSRHVTASTQVSQRRLIYPYPIFLPFNKPHSFRQSRNDGQRRQLIL